MERLYDLPHNQLRKALALRACIGNLEGLQRKYGPIFDEDPAVIRILEQVRVEYDQLMSILRNREDALDLLMKEDPL